jgi:cyclophilin family peptidyl-prolyl cis-trans isomerase
MSNKNLFAKPYFLLLFICLLVSCFSIKSQFSIPSPSSINLNEKSPDSFLVAFNTTKGDFTMKARRFWAPLACDRFYQLAKNHFYDSCVIFRVAQAKSCNGAFVVQFGIVNNLGLNKEWDSAVIKDEPVVVPQRAGGVVFARSGPNTRSAQIAITVTPCPEMDTVSNKTVVGFPTFAEVETGLDVIKTFYSKYGNSVFEAEDSLLLGREYFDRVFPGLDRINTTSVTKKW